MGDCGIAVLSKGGNSVLLTDDELSRARRYFPSSDDPVSDRVARRRDYRNKPNAEYLTYGVLTGETTELSYVKTGRTRLHADDTVVIFSDGIRSLFTDNDFMRTLQSGDGVEEAIRERCKIDMSLNDDITLLVRPVSEGDVSKRPL